MAGESTANPPSSRTAGGRTTPVLVPQAALAGRPDIPLDRPVTTVGASENSRLHLISRTISNSHALLVNSGGTTYVADLASRTGVIVNGNVVHDCELKTGDRLQIGKFLFRYRSPSNNAPAAVMPESPPASVIVVGSPAIPITGRISLIGRRETCEIPFTNDSAVSAAHAIIFQMDGQWFIRDLASRTGTVVNDKVIHQQALRFGDRIQIGSSRILFQPAKAPVAVEDDLPPVRTTPVAREKAPPTLPTPVLSGDLDLIPLADEPIAASQPQPVVAEKYITDPLEHDLEFEPTVADEIIPAVAPAVPDVLGDTLVAAEHADQHIPVAPAEPVVDEAIAVDAAIDVPTEIEPEIPVAQAAPEPEAIELAPEPPAIEEEAEPVVAEETLPEVVPEIPIAQAVIEPEPAPVEIAVKSPAVEEPAAQIVAEEAPPEVVPEIPMAQAVIEPEPAPVEIVDESPAVEEPVAPVVAEEPLPIIALPTPPSTAEIPLAKAEEFVFVPASEAVDPNSVPEEIFWGDPELDPVIQHPVAEQPVATPAAHEAPIPAPIQPPPVAAAVPEVAPVIPVIAEEPALELPDLAEFDEEPLEEVSLADIGDESTSHASTQKDETLPLPAEPTAIDTEVDAVDDDFWKSIEESDEPVNLAQLEPLETPAAPIESTVSVETVLGEEAAAPVEDFSPEGNVTVTTDGSTGEGHAVVNEYVAGESLPGDTAAVLDLEAATTESDLLAAESPDQIEGLDEVSTGETIAKTGLEPDDDELSVGLEWIDDGSAEDFGTVDDLQMLEPSTESQPVAEAITPVAEVVTPVEGIDGSEADDLDFLEFAEPESADTKPAPDAPQVLNSELQTDPESPAKPRSKPSIFGFNFEGGSFLGGMPLKLKPPVPPPATVFDSQSMTRSGLSDSGQASQAAGQAPAPTTTPPASPVATPASVTSTTPIEAAPTLLKRPITPPRPAMNPVNNQAPVALSGLVSDSQNPWAGPPEIPPTARQAARAAAVLPTNSAFSAPGAKPKNREVFSQMTAPIGIEVFGGRPGNPSNIKVPDSSETRAVENNPDEANPASAPGSTAAAPLAVQPMPRRGSKIPLLVILLILLPASVFALIYRFVPIQAKVVGTLDFAGIEKLSAQDARSFMLDQESRLRDKDGDIRGTARGLLVSEGIDPGLTDDSVSFDRAVENPAAIGWSGKTLQFEYSTTDPKAGPKQVWAVLESLRLKDKDLDDARARAQLAEEDAATQTVRIKTQADLLGEQRRAQALLAQDRPSKSVIDQLDADATRLNQRWSDAKTILQGSTSVLADLRKQDPSKPIDADADPEVIDLRKQLVPLNDQIAKLKQATPGGAATAEAVVDASDNAATTQPANADPLLMLLQQQSDQLSQKLEHRRAELQADAALTPDQRQANLQAAIENMSIKLAALEREEGDDKTAAQQATAAADAAHRKLDAARLADARVDDLLVKEEAAKKDWQDALTNENDKQTAVDACVTVVRDAKPQTTTTETSDPRLALSLLGSGVLVALLVWAIIAEAGRPAMVSGITPAAAPLVSPPQRIIPWPQPHQLDALEGGNGNREEAENPEEVDENHEPLAGA